MTDKYYPEPPSFEQPDFDFAIKENPLLQGLEQLSAKTEKLDAFCQGLLYSNAAILAILQESGNLDVNHAAGVLHRISSLAKQQLTPEQQLYFQIPFDQLRAFLKPPQGDAPDNVVSIPDPKSPQDQ
ncbi:TPA: hypothetical protein ACHY13_002901 [Pseudomonas aeruginosa]|uniref:hypothetical protein n=1 Tax=Pseudomonas aeruginosa TaxID=287 RepID=UPI0013C51068|nr:hypothetical protein [Pseudomonas aeruginosa]MBA5102873.1 hypothetical protein [Pseudomonas aeruginosa]MBX6149719.1 hypothetical protein [Pseudomonas aeruginosa]MBX6176433.1 hypothetical protein [Pseudomonas aeruginosa]HBO3581710.1 hypothetical protein [Pseudomonas aeruginosa]HBO5583691.1 hypothetical protein [Pseudomonas aeruginosa]